MSFWDEIKDAYSGLEASDAVDLPLWMLNRPQQAVYQAGQQGAKAFEGRQGAIDKAFPNSPVPWGVASGLSAISTLPSAIRGAWSGATGQSPDISGHDIVNDLDIPDWGKSVGGTSLDLTADPTAMLPALQSQKLGTVRRTANNLWDTYRHAPETFGRLKKMGWGGMLSSDIASAPSFAGDLMPVTLRQTGNPIPLAKELGLKTSADRAKGWISPQKDIIAADVTKENPSWVHEFVHWATQQFDRPELDQAFMNVVRHNPKVAERFRGLGNYGRLNPNKIGEEMMANATGRGAENQLKAFTPKNAEFYDVLNSLVNTARDAVPQAVYQAAKPLGVAPVVPIIQSLLRNLGYSGE